MKSPIRTSILADLEKAAPVAQASPGAALPVEPQAAAAAVAPSPAPQPSTGNAVTAPQTVPAPANWRTLPKKIQTTQFNVRIRSDLYESLKDLATYSPDDTMTSIAARGIEKEIALMLFERGEAPE